MEADGWTLALKCVVLFRAEGLVGAGFAHAIAFERPRRKRKLSCVTRFPRDAFFVAVARLVHPRP